MRMNISIFLILRSKIILLILLFLPPVSGFSQITSIDNLNQELGNMQVSLTFHTDDMRDTNTARQISIRTPINITTEALVRQYYQLFAALYYLDLTNGISDAFNIYDSIIFYEDENNESESVIITVQELLQLISDRESQTEFTWSLKLKLME